VEAKTVNELNFLQNKVSKVRKSCVTPEQKSTYQRYAELYRERIARYNDDFRYRLRVDAIAMAITSFLVAGFLAFIIVAMILRSLNH
jgi:hypothetical protein